MKFEYIDSNRGRYTIEMMARTLGISPRSYYNYRNGTYRDKEIIKENTKQKIVDVYFESKGTYGSPRIASELNAIDFPISRATVALYMKEMGIKSKLSPKFRIATTDSRHGFYIADNLLNRQFKVYEPSQAWVTDITYIHTLDGFIYLTTVIDLFDRKIIGWNISDNMTASETTVSALKMAVMNRGVKPGTIIHSDRGVQYACDEFKSLVEKYKMVQSMSRKGNCWDNAVAESFFKTLKCELIYDHKEISAKQMELLVFEYIELWYNKKRRHSTLGNLTIDEFWLKFIEEKIENDKLIA